MPKPLRPPPIARQGASFVLAGALQLMLDWVVFVALTALGMAPAPANLAGRVCGALLGFWFNGRYTFAGRDGARLGWRRFLRFAAIWLVLTAVSTATVAWVAAQLGLQQAWLAKPLVEGALAAVAFFLWRQVVYR